MDTDQAPGPETKARGVAPFAPAPFFQAMQREMNQLLERFRTQPLASPDSFFDAIGTGAYPAIDVAETEGALEITADLPGVQEDNLDISISGDVLTLKGEKSSDHEQKDADYHMVERRYGRFRRQMPLGFTPEDGAVEATFTDGVLKLKIAKPDGARNFVQKIKVNRG
ncbi:heat shock protein Hsp20 [Roseivivax lentus]|uniref:Heat shock protein Hsp20 n=1 Tax=Roseivivax lentus TaxID=633194 RepID=A0A1N7LPD6_9RHOB|nr:Hsp20/alpha crystallin family protein [Roseivivax lentus]SIS75624.1 heat shock protein Hsp20 [Roseivivax lentus]